MDPLRLTTPRIDPSAVVSPGSHIHGDVEIGANVFILFGVVIRAEFDKVTIGSETNIQDNTVVHCDEGIPCHIGRHVTVGHGAVIHGATIGDGALIGIGSTVLNNSVVGEGAWLAAGSVLTEGAEIPPRTLALGTPARSVRGLSEDEIQRASEGVAHYQSLARVYRDLFA